MSIATDEASAKSVLDDAVARFDTIEAGFRDALEWIDEERLTFNCIHI